ncbi:hypothetical protein NBRC3280_2587 [Acetobacter pasteurianus NBRC 3280]|uniref:AAA family ATPase n=1 Tax=Acetobacter pasteurianus TaxID=438 RepID=UPI000F5532E4|nr:AAA family ATPase [Acetobacter pasteurianus]GCD60101.1 hypothetical protein NBRC3277_2676 [Acetobacter pasteurianus NBRC 3277]GCD69952.1 hypothetical protein NBRC3280_2587 [Acetobacter pasteurianus NBRC 3280]
MFILYIRPTRINTARRKVLVLRVVVKKILFPKLDGPPSDDLENYMFLGTFEDENGSLTTAKFFVRSVSHVSPGGCYEVEGDWKRTAKGEEFNSWCLIPSVPDTFALSCVYLNGLFPPEMCGTSALSRRLSALTREYGPDVLVRALATPTILTRLSDQPEIFAANILRLWEAATRESHMALMMHRAGFTTGDLDMVWRGCAFKVAERIGGDPYQLVAIPGIDVAKADMLFRTFGGNPYDPRRIAGIIRRSLMASEGLSATNDDGEKIGFTAHVEFPGSTAVDVTDILTSGKAEPLRDDLISGIDPKIGMRLDVLRDFLAKPQEALKFGLRIRKTRDGRTLVARERVYQAEVRIARNIARLLQAPPLKDKATVQATCRNLFNQPDFQRFDAVQRTAVEMACYERFCVITGGPGTGKSTILDAVIAARVAMGTEKRSFLLGAPTATAALRMTETTGLDAATIQSLLKCKGEKAGGEQWFDFNRNNPLPSGCTVYVDEGSMVDIFLSDHLLDAIPTDASLLILGEDGQLLSVGPGAFLENLLNTRTMAGDRVVPAICLQNTYRSNPKSNLAIQAKEIRYGGVPTINGDSSGGTSMQSVVPEKISSFIVYAMSNVMPALGIQNPVKDVAVLGPQNPGVGGLWEINSQMSRYFNPNGAKIPGLSAPRFAKEMPVPRVGDRVMRRKNVKGDKLCVNGSRGFIEAYIPPSPTDPDAKKGKIKIRFDNNEVRTEDVSWDWHKKFELAYALTIHKSQGQQYQYVLMVITPEHANMLDNSLVYTGWTRAKEGVAVVGSFDAFAGAVQRSRMNTRLTMLPDLLSEILVPGIADEFRSRWYKKPPMDDLPRPGGREKWFQTKYGNASGHKIRTIEGIKVEAPANGVQAGLRGGFPSPPSQPHSSGSGPTTPTASGSHQAPPVRYAVNQPTSSPPRPMFTGGIGYRPNIPVSSALPNPPATPSYDKKGVINHVQENAPPRQPNTSHQDATSPTYPKSNSAVQPSQAVPLQAVGLQSPRRFGWSPTIRQPAAAPATSNAQPTARSAAPDHVPATSRPALPHRPVRPTTPVESPSARPVPASRPSLGFIGWRPNIHPIKQTCHEPQPEMDSEMGMEDQHSSSYEDAPSP